MIETRVFVWKSKNMKPNQPISFTLVEICLKQNEKLMRFTASPNLNAKFCREYMQEGGRKIEATDSTGYHVTLWNKKGSDRTS